MDMVSSFLSCVEASFNIEDSASQIASILETLITGEPRDKKLKKTQSWSSNCLIRLYHSHASLKEGLNMPEFVAQVKGKETV